LIHSRCRDRREMSAPRDTERACPERACIDLECNETMDKSDLFERSRPVQNDADGFWEALFEEWQRRKKEPSAATNERILRMLEQYKNGEPSSALDPFHLDCVLDCVPDCVHDASPELSRGNEIVEGFSDFYGGGL